MSNESNAVAGGRTDYNDPAGWIKPPPLETWLVFGSTGTPVVAQNEKHALALVTCRDVDYPTLGPHRAVRMVEAP